MTFIPQSVRDGAIRTQQPLSRARHLPAHFYTSPEIYEREKEQIFQKEWLCLGRVEELDQPGEYLTFRIAGEPIVICKDRQGEIRAFSNVCRHRGTQVAFGESDNGTPFGKGCDKVFSCPYHGWVYDLDGRLVNVPHSKEMEDFNTEDFNLVSLQVGTWAGFLFVNFNTTAPSLIDVLNEVDFPATYQPYRYEDFRLASKFSFELDCNWKFVNENLTDIYHIAVLHVNTFGPWQPLDSYEFRPVPGGYHGYFKGKTLAPNGDSLFGTIPWLSGKLAEGGFSSHLRPNVAWFPRHDFLCFMTTWPGESLDKTVGVSYQLFPKQHFEQPDFQEKVKVYDEFLQSFLSEDILMIKSLQQGMSSKYFQPGPMSRFEVAIHSIANYYLERMGNK